ncbi:uncharacterized protein THITE_2039753 [Thermothielavioides terrestris NRRL 8126]|uniref:SH3 domain-containing protein n=1 Tax=Thermothielavioides terrestris (strain ATCC 38088 / NRRL 8126) TaxID=578455 RepID=G2QVA2_THETT|nr:uncharacterized protein THITE_2039753 [Thermothielavioides terrestris NRRL 8126]AEO63789.1 hypothetical protein THITE_2039753 [Thermothielavioides terrestris NRRL 8126]
MAVDAEELLIRPFRDVVALGAVAVTNAETHASHEHAGRMSKAAQAVVREGERALTKVQLVWNDQVARYGNSFRETIVEQASLHKVRMQLEELLWDFEDFTHPDEFDQARYSALQAATKAMALRLIDTAKRVTFEPNVPALPPGGFPPLPPPPGRSKSRIRAASQPPSTHASCPRGSSKSLVTAQDDDKHKRQVPPRSTPPTGDLRSLISEFPAPAPSVKLRPKGSVEDNLHRVTAIRPSRSQTSVGSSASISSLPLGSPVSLNTPEDVSEPSHPTAAKIEAAPPISTSQRAQDAATPSLPGFDDFLRQSIFLDEHRQSQPDSPRIPDLAIRRDSTYHKLGGFCRGAKKFRKDGNWDRIRLSADTDHGGGADSVGGDATRVSDALMIPFQYGRAKVGACVECGYSHDQDDVLLDKGGKPEAIRTSESGARYRLRLLFKSHLRQGGSSETRYACLWCIRARRTVREADATVFRSAEDLLRHLARHPQPLPPIPGVSVCYGEMAASDPPEFDLHLPESPTPVLMPENVSRLATAVAVKDHYRRPGRARLEKPPMYEADMLEFMEGARITGIIFPEKWLGKYCLGRHDGEFGAFPAKAIELRPPQESEIPVGGENGISVTARWKWQPPSTTGDAPWLSFAKGEVITDVQCLYADYWCWSGRNAKGQTGVFPQSHIDLQTLRDTAQDHDLAVHKKGWGRGLFGSRSNNNSAEVHGVHASHRRSIAA